VPDRRRRALPTDVRGGAGQTRAIAATAALLEEVPMNPTASRRTAMALLAAGVLLASGCADMTERERSTVIGGNLWSKRMEDRRAAMERATRGSNVEVTRTADNQLRLNVPNDISFDTNGYAIKPQLRGILDPFASSLAGDPKAIVRVVGHTDGTGSAAINNPLSVERAQSVRDYLVARGLSPIRIEASGHGAREPIADNASEAGRARNRRVEIFLREPA
jgi:outer membrane protein OmpA-like peptidoglycan-associated protein